MAYSKSKARIEFETTLGELISLSRDISFKTIDLSYDHKNLIYQSTIVLICSAFEEYLRVFVEDLFYTYKSKNASLSNINSITRAFAMFYNHRAIYEAYIHTKDEVKILERLDLKSNCYKVLDDHGTYVNQIDANRIVNDRKYPSPKNIRSLYNRLGLKNVFGIINNSGNKDYEMILRSFLDIRETIAHKKSINLTFLDIKRNARQIEEIINRLDRAAFSLICKSSGIAYWN